MKIAFLFLIKDNVCHLDLWKKFFENNEDKYNIYVHNKQPLTDDFFSKFVIPETIETSWGKMNIVEATLLLLKYALENAENQRFILLSETTIPVKNFNYIYNFLTPDRNYFKVTDYRKQAGHQWFIINRKFCEFCVKFDCTKIWHFSIPDEQYFIRLLFKFRISFKNFQATHCDWKNAVINNHGGRSPKTYNKITKHELIKLVMSPHLFARKFTNECQLDYNLILS